MKRRFPAVLQYFAVGLLAAACASAAPVACPASGTFATLVGTNAGGGCLVGDQLFSGFTYSSSATGSSIALTQSQFTYTTVVNAPVAIGFQFAGAIGALPNSSMTISIGWVVNGTAIQSDHLGFTATFFGNASARVDETYCKGGAVAGCPAADTGELSVFRGQGIGSQLVDQIQFAPVGILGVEKTITVTAGALSFANISDITQTIDLLSEIPEPSTTLVVSSGLLALTVIRRRYI